MSGARVGAFWLLILVATGCDGVTYTCPDQSPPITQPSVVASIPRDCASTCDYYLTLTPNANNHSYLDIHLEANATGWVAVGFSLDMKMFNDDVLGCQHNPKTNEVTVVDAWNPKKQHDPNQIDPNQDGICPYQLDFTNGRINCSFSRYYGIVNPGFDYDLKQQPYHLLLGRSNNGANGTVNFPFHNPVIPTPTDFAVNPFSSNSPNNSRRDYQCPNTTSFSKPKNAVLGIPNHCTDKPSTCDYYIAMSPNPSNSSYVDIHLEGTGKGWIAVGFSNDQLMEKADVLGCKYDASSDRVYVINSWNPGPGHTPNEIDPTQKGMCIDVAEESNGRIYCNFSRYAGVINEGYDFDLNGSYYLLLGTSEKGSSNVTGFPKHSATPLISDSKVNPYMTNNSKEISSLKRKLLKTHGILMVIAFPLLVACSTFIAAWTRPLFPRKIWFQAHRAFMIFALILALSSFGIVFYANKDNRHPGLLNFECPMEIVHFTFGIAVMFLMILNPIVSLLRCEHTDSRRWIYNLVHGQIIGGTTLLLALTNVGAGLYMFQSGCGLVTAQNNSMLWIYIGWVAFFVATYLTLFGVFTNLTFTAPTNEQVSLAPSLIKLILYREKIHQTPQKADYKKLNAEDESIFDKCDKVASISMAALIVFMGITVMVMLALVVMIALGINFGA